jgi:hypothetical protein
LFEVVIVTIILPGHQHSNLLNCDPRNKALRPAPAPMRQDSSIQIATMQVFGVIKQLLSFQARKLSDLGLTSRR